MASENSRIRRLPDDVGDLGDGGHRARVSRRLLGVVEHDAHEGALRQRLDACHDVAQVVSTASSVKP